MVGGPDAAFERARPLFEAMGKNITHVGSENGAGQTCKVANQIIVALNLQAVSEALVFAARAGADPAKVRQAIMGGFAASRVLELHAERMLKGNFEPGFPGAAAPEGPKPGSDRCEGNQCGATKHGGGRADARVLCGPRRRGSGPLSDRAGHRGAGRRVAAKQAVGGTSRPNVGTRGISATPGMRLARRVSAAERARFTWS